ncbi:hypothetical protein O3M35_013313 [Rhynocoris fuscipes]|uniref:Uncharacterized protein n=1 Tax=Rhynocoris fuscipes TaxID=488301 RepID=A0AAW1CEN8_9HEMI
MYVLSPSGLFNELNNVNRFTPTTRTTTSATVPRKNNISISNNADNTDTNANKRSKVTIHDKSCMTVTPMFGCAACSIPIHLLTEQHNSMASKLLLSSCSSVTSALNLQEAANGSGGSNTTKVAFNSSNYSNISECANTNTQDDFALRLSQQLLRRANKEFK